MKLLLKEFRSLFLGQELGHGMSRSVYVNAQDPTTVIKIEEGAKRFQNIREWETWKNYEYCKDVAKWLAPCVDISSCGLILIQKRVDPLLLEKAPNKMPAFLTDFKLNNFGIYKGKIVCSDYGILIDNYSTKLKKVPHWF